MDDVGVLTTRPMRRYEVAPELPIPAGAVGEWAALSEVLEVAVTPCQAVDDAEAWWDPDRYEEACEGCVPCPARVPCLAYAMAAGERHGVWGGLSPEGRRELPWRRS